MTEAVLAWQAIILASIGLAGRWRWWVVAFWVVWTLIQVTALPLSVLQFATIGLGSWIFTPKSPKTDHRPSTQAPIASDRPAAAAASLEHEPIKPERPSLLTTLDKWSRDMERRTREMAQRQAFHRAAQETIKTSDFSCEVEEQIMKEALARDQELTRNLQRQLAADSVLRSLYERALEKTTKVSFGGVAARQLAERSALEIAQSHRGYLDHMYEMDPQRLARFLDTLAKVSQQLTDAGHPSDEEPNNILGRPISEWLEDLRRSRDITALPSEPPKREGTKLGLFASARKAGITTLTTLPRSISPHSQEEVGTSVQWPLVNRCDPLPNKTATDTAPPAPSVAYVTQSTFSRLAKEWFRPENVSVDAIFGYIYEQTLGDILNHKEAAEMYVRKSLIQGRASELKVGDRSFDKKYVFSVGQPKFHAASDCPYLLSEFRNYLVPKEIERLGPAKVREFQTFCDKNKNELRDKTPDVFWAHVSAHFRLSISPQPVTLPNSGTQHIDSASINEIEMRIREIISEAKGILEAEGKDSPVSRMRYAGNPGRAVAQVKDKQAQALVARFFELKKDLLKLLFDFYKKEQGVKDLALPVELLLEAHLGPCKGCWPKSGATQQLN